jgi:hypothetical protein
MQRWGNGADDADSCRSGIVGHFFTSLPEHFAILGYIVGGIALVTSVIGFCPAWATFRMNTCGAKQVHARAGGPER